MASSHTTTPKQGVPALPMESGTALSAEGTALSSNLFRLYAWTQELIYRKLFEADFYDPRLRWLSTNRLEALVREGTAPRTAATKQGKQRASGILEQLGYNRQERVTLSERKKKRG